ncbi:MAG: ammonia-forming cytochrome c nitrite reductase subunit c552, partial [Proteobacteria bacterium]|nr:ammonia-forming cytochrome c nitrite reductase subunit c552 [Pseudomonadota bacterium]
CLTCHRESEAELKDVVARKLERKDQLNEIAMDNIAKAHLEAGKALELGAKQGEMSPIQDDIRSAQWIWDYSIASHGSFYHAPEETLRLLSVANEKAQQARLKLVKVLAKYGAINYMAPDFSTKANAQKLAGVPLAKLAADKMNFKRTLMKAWTETAIANNKLDPDIRKGMSDNVSYPKN